MTSKGFANDSGALPEATPASPTLICCFVGIPGCGKTALSNSLAPELVSLALPGNPYVSLKRINSDRLQKMGYDGWRYWYDVEEASRAKGQTSSCKVVVVDKNLVPSPPGNIERVSGILRTSGAVMLALVPTVTGVTSVTVHPELYTDLPPLPFTLELVALCMLRTLTRERHENLDARNPSAASVVALFAMFFRNTTRGSLLDSLRTSFRATAELPIATAAADDAAKQVPLEVLQHIAAGLAAVQPTAKPPLPHAWETRARQLLLDANNKTRILGMQHSLAECQAEMLTTIVAAFQGVVASPVAAA